MVEEDPKDTPPTQDDPPKNDPPTPPKDEPAQPDYVPRSEFDQLKTAVDGLVDKVGQIAPQTPHDTAPGGKPWTHWGTKDHS